jgi:hypothetical protein
MVENDERECDLTERLTDIILESFENDLFTGVAKEEDETEDNHYNPIIKDIAFDEDGERIARWFRRYDKFYLVCTKDKHDINYDILYIIAIRDILRSHYKKIDLQYEKIPHIIKTSLPINLDGTVTLLEDPEYKNAFVLRYPVFNCGVSTDKYIVRTRNVVLDEKGNLSQLSRAMYEECRPLKVEYAHYYIHYSRKFVIYCSNHTVGTLNNSSVPLDITFVGKLKIYNPIPVTGGDDVSYDKEEIDVLIPMKSRTVKNVSSIDYFHLLDRETLYNAAVYYIKELFSQHELLKQYYRVTIEKKTLFEKEVVEATVDLIPSYSIPQALDIEFVQDTVTQPFAAELGVSVQPFNGFVNMIQANS